MPRIPWPEALAFAEQVARNLMYDHDALRDAQGRRLVDRRPVGNAADVVQRALVKAHTREHQLNGHDWHPWLRRIVANEVNDHFRREARRGEVPFESPDSDDPDRKREGEFHADTPEHHHGALVGEWSRTHAMMGPEELVLRYEHARLARGLTRRERDVARLLADGYDEEEIAAELGSTTAGVKMALSRARRAMGVPSTRKC